MVAENGGVSVLIATWGMTETRSEVVQPGDWFKADVVIWVHFSYFLSDEVIGILHMDGL